jgi:hypothetical protein
MEEKIKVEKGTFCVGSKVRIYFDPLTEEDYEGHATLLKREAEVGVWEGRVAARWVVRFRGESQKLLRTVLEPLKKEPENTSQLDR